MMRVVFTVALLGASSSAFAQDAAAVPVSSDLKMQNGAFVIEGKVQKPEVIVVINRDSLDQGFDLGLEESFLPKIVDALSEDPF